MAAPPTCGIAALDGFDGPVIVWDDHRAARYTSDMDEVEATRWSTILGAIMLANALGREGRRYLSVSDAAEVAREVRGL